MLPSAVTVGGGAWLFYDAPRAAVILAEPENAWVLYVLAERVTDQFRGAVSLERYARQDVPPQYLCQVDRAVEVELCS